MDTYRIEWRPSALRELKRLDRQAVPRIVSSIEGLSLIPTPHGCRKLAGSEHTYRIRVGDYRVIYDIFANHLVIEIVRVRHRKDAYRVD